MGHYDSCYEFEAKEDAKRKREQAKSLLQKMQKLKSEIEGSFHGVSQRHLDALDDMINETDLRSRAK